jgi:hypothetical protein
MTRAMTEVPAARFEDTATERGSEGILRRVGAFVEAYGVDSVDRAQIAHTLAAVLDAAAAHASRRADARIAVIADVMPSDVQLLMRLSPGSPSLWGDGGEPVGGFELWISFPRE